MSALSLARLRHVELKGKLLVLAFVTSQLAAYLGTVPLQRLAQRLLLPFTALGELVFRN